MELASKGYATVLANTNEDPDLQRSMIASLVEHGVSGFIISPAYGDDDATYSLLKSSGIPSLQVFRSLMPCEDVPFLAPDYKRGGLLATRHLLEKGCKRIAFLGGLEGRSVTQERMSGYLTELNSHGVEPLILTGEATRSFGKQMVTTLREDHPDVDGLICFNDLVALGALAACTASGIKVGHDLLVVGFDDIEDCQDSYPALSSVSCDIPSFAKRTAEKMLAWINENTAPAPNERTGVELIVRTSSNVS
jgi:LacI family transcriptional regulator